MMENDCEKIFNLEDFRLRNDIDFSMKNCFSLLDFLCFHYHMNSEDWLKLLFLIIDEFEEGKKKYEVYQSFNLNNFKITQKKLKLTYVFDQPNSLFKNFFEDFEHKNFSIKSNIETNFDYLCLTISLDIFLNFVENEERKTIDGKYL